jgi:uncharacterized protein YecT (DUF1311 family)
MVSTWKYFSRLINNKRGVMKDQKIKPGLSDDIATAIGAGGLGVSKSMIAGYFVARFLHNKRIDREEKEDARVRAQHEQAREQIRAQLEHQLNELERQRGRTTAFLEKLEEFEAQYGPRRKTDFDTLNTSPHYARAPEPSQQFREVSGALLIGIFFLPYIFGWLTLRRGYSNTTRTICFLWMMVGLTIVGRDIDKHFRAAVPASTPNQAVDNHKREQEPAQVPLRPTIHGAPERSEDAAPTRSAVDVSQGVAAEHGMDADNPVIESSSPSFNCAKASSDAERLICSSPELSKADVRLNQAYGNAVARTSDRAALKNEQNFWRKNNRDACVDEACMLRAYKNRVEELE